MPARPRGGKSAAHPSKQIPHGVQMTHKEAVEKGRKGGLKGGPARAQALHPSTRAKIARKAANVRWHGTADKKTAETEAES